MIVLEKEECMQINEYFIDYCMYDLAASKFTWWQTRRHNAVSTLKTVQPFNHWLSC